VNAQDKDGWTALHIAVKLGHEDIIRELVSKKRKNVIVDAANKIGNTPLHKASSLGCVSNVEMLIKAKANLYTTNNDGRTALHLAAIRGNLDIVVKLLFVNCTKAKELAKIEDRLGGTALRYAAHGGHTEIVFFLIEKNIGNADVNGKDGNDTTALHEASILGHAETIQMLLEHGADVNATDKFDRTPLHIAAGHGYVDTVTILLEAGADPEIAASKCGGTPLEWAKENGHGKVADLIKAKMESIAAGTCRRLIAQTPEPLVDCAKLTSNMETPAIAVSSDVLTLLVLAFALLLGFLFYRCVKARRSRPRVLAYPVGLLGAPIEARQNLASNHDDA